MSETQAYKKDLILTLPANGAGYVRDLFAHRLENLREVMGDENARRVFSRDDLVNMAFEAVTLAKMVATMSKQEAAHA